MNIKQIITAIFIISASFSCSNAKKERKAGTEENKIPVRVMTVKKEIIPRSVEYPVELIADKEVYYAPASPGRIHCIYVNVGDRIRKGQLLVEMDNTSLIQAKTQLKKAENDYIRAKELRKTESISRQAFEAAETAYHIAAANFDFLKENTKMSAPFDGIVTGKFYENGEMFSSAPNTKAGKAAIISIEKIDPIKAHVYITEQFFPNIKKDIGIELTTSLYPGKKFNGKVKIVYPTIDPQSRTFALELVIPNKEEKLRPGMTGSIKLNLSESEAMIVPSLSVLKLQGSNVRYVFVVREGKAKLVNVKTGRRFEDEVEIISDEIKEGDRLVIYGQARLKEGSPVYIAQ